MLTATVTAMAPVAPPPKVSLLVTDLDNTLWDWFEAWHASFSALLYGVSRLSGVPIDTLETETRVVHQLRGTSEYSYLLNELPSLLAITPDPMTTYDDAVHAQNAFRKRVTRLYPGVLGALHALRAKNIPIVGYTESPAFWTEWRIRTLSLDGLLTALYSPLDHGLPDGVSFDALRTLPPEEYGLKKTEHRHIPSGVEKPSPEILRNIIDDFHGATSTTLYVGDSLIKDVAMAQDVGVLDAHAAYGAAQHEPGYDLLRRVTHWTDATVQRERDAAEKAGIVTPTYTLAHRFDEALALFQFVEAQ